MKAEALYRKGTAFRAQALQLISMVSILNFEMLTTTYDARVWQSLKITPASKADYMAIRK
jgi:hypothetical protein